MWGPRLWARGWTKKTKQNNSRTWGVIFQPYREKKPWSDLDKILHCRRYPGRNHPCKFWDRSVKGFSVAMGQILGFSIGFRRRLYNTLVLRCESVIYGTLSLLKGPRDVAAKRANGSTLSDDWRTVSRDDNDDDDDDDDVNSVALRSRLLRTPPAAADRSRSGRRSRSRRWGNVDWVSCIIITSLRHRATALQLQYNSNTTCSIVVVVVVV